MLHTSCLLQYFLFSLSFFSAFRFCLFFVLFLPLLLFILPLLSLSKSYKKMCCWDITKTGQLDFVCPFVWVSFFSTLYKNANLFVCLFARYTFLLDNKHKNNNEKIFVHLFCFQKWVHNRLLKVVYSFTVSRHSYLYFIISSLVYVLKFSQRMCIGKRKLVIWYMCMCLWSCIHLSWNISKGIYSCWKIWQADFNKKSK